MQRLAELGSMGAPILWSQQSERLVQSQRLATISAEHLINVCWCNVLHLFYFRGRLRILKGIAKGIEECLSNFRAYIDEELNYSALGLADQQPEY